MQETMLLLWNVIIFNFLLTQLNIHFEAVVHVLLYRTAIFCPFLLHQNKDIIKTLQYNAVQYNKTTNYSLKKYHKSKSAPVGRCQKHFALCISLSGTFQLFLIHTHKAGIENLKAWKRKCKSSSVNFSDGCSMSMQHFLAVSPLL